MLCPVCNETLLRGRQKICSTKCRSASYRQRKRPQQSTPQTEGPQLSNRRPRSSRREDAGRWEQLLTTATDRIVEALLKHGNGSLSQHPSDYLVDLRTQVISQAPKQAIGYRLVLPGHCASDGPKLSPKRSQARASSWYSLTPFEYPDDLRLRDRSCYRVIWFDTAGLRIRLIWSSGAPVLLLRDFLPHQECRLLYSVVRQNQNFGLTASPLFAMLTNENPGLCGACATGVCHRVFGFEMQRHFARQRLGL